MSEAEPMVLPSRAKAIWFGVRAAGLRLQRQMTDLFKPVRRWPQAQSLAVAPVLAEVRTPLWEDGRAEEEFSLVAGKVHNLRLAVGAFDGIEIPAGEVMSFWRQLGRVTARRGFVQGREVREGCVIPTLGGGLCQLSNALATCAVRAGFTLVERHGHTHRVEAGGTSGATQGAVDATVFWNYVDLRVSAPQAWRLEVKLTRSALVLCLRGWEPVVPSAAPPPVPTQTPLTFHHTPPTGAAEPAVARGCLSCNETVCFRHREHARPAGPLVGQRGRSAWLLDAWTPEFEAHLQGQVEDRDVMVPRAPQWRRWRVPGRTAWRVDAPSHVAWGVFLRRAMSARWSGQGGQGGRRQARVLRGQAWLAANYAQRLQPYHTHLVVDQALLPYLWRDGVLGGRRFEVLMHSLPMVEVQQRLDAAGRRWPQDTSLNDFRVDPALAQAEAEALRHAERLVTPHREIARVMRAATVATVHCLDWQLPDAPTIGPLMSPIAETAAPCIVLGASALGRKGVNELAQALQGHACEVWVLGSQASDPAVWGSLTVRSSGYGGDWPRHASALVLPAHIEHAPRAALRALANGVPVVATPACGLEGVPGVVTVQPGDVPALLAALQPWLRSAPSTRR